MQRKMPRFLPILLAFCMFTTGASGLVNEYVLATITTYILGNSIEQFSMVIASMMLMMGVSGFVQNKMSDDNLLQKFIAVEVIMALLGGFAPLAIYAAYGYLENSFQIIHYFFVLSVGFLIGFEIPLVMRIIDQHKIKLKTNLTLVYAMDYVGAFVGAVIWVQYLLKNYPLTEISFIVAGFNFMVASITIIYFLKQKLILKPTIYIVILIVTSALLIIGFASNRDISSLLEQRFYEDPIVHQETTKYQHLVLTHNSNSGDTRLYINGNTQFSSLDEKRYHDFLVHPLMEATTSRDNLLILGGGDGLALREVNKYPDVRNITVVDLDPDMVTMASTHKLLTDLNNDSFKNANIATLPFRVIDSGAKQGVYLSENGLDSKPKWVASVTVYNIDADLFLRDKPKQKWDAVIIDLPDPSGIEISKLYSKQFYQNLKRYLTADAYISIQSTSPYHAKDAYLAIGSTLNSAGFKVLPYRQNIPSFGDWGYYLAWTTEEKPINLKKRLSKLKDFSVDTDFITPELLASSFAFGKGELQTKRPCINTLMEPCLLTAYTDRGWQIE
ncbi:MAG: spermidine synthase [Oleispira sp.]|jgi:spermidine synthase